MGKRYPAREPLGFGVTCKRKAPGHLEVSRSSVGWHVTRYVTASTYDLIARFASKPMADLFVRAMREAEHG